MSGHSKWATIKHTKGLADAKRGVMFAKLAKDITVAVQVGQSGDQAFNPMLRVAVDKAKASNMPNDKIEKAINKGMGISDKDSITYENSYEAYGPGGIGLIIDTETDSPNRTITDIKVALNKGGGKIANEGSVSWKFKEMGKITFDVLEKAGDKDQQFDEYSLGIMDLPGIVDIVNEESEGSLKMTVMVEKEHLRSTNNALSEMFGPKIKIESINLVKVTEDIMDADDESLEKLQGLISKIEECPDVTNIWTDVGLIS